MFNGIPIDIDININDDKVTKSKIEVIWSMRKWPKEYIKWRFVTAYPNGWKFVYYILLFL